MIRRWKIVIVRSLDNPVLNYEIPAGVHRKTWDFGVLLTANCHFTACWISHRSATSVREGKVRHFPDTPEKNSHFCRIHSSASTAWLIGQQVRWKPITRLNETFWFPWCRFMRISCSRCVWLFFLRLYRHKTWPVDLILVIKAGEKRSEDLTNKEERLWYERGLGINFIQHR